mmetsp:Transcript_2227/g.6644  ORF Transcript_2227/g.6644 Transcript_2227/m.6644 type:complete len:94 (+) Transcript_2227:70-351(+)
MKTTATVLLAAALVAAACALPIANRVDSEAQEVVKGEADTKLEAASKISVEELKEKVQKLSDFLGKTKPGKPVLYEPMAEALAEWRFAPSKQK